MKIEGSVVFITGANRGLGLQFAKAALARKAKKVYAAARDPSKVSLPGAIPVKLDVTNAADAAAAAQQCPDVTILVNNAGIVRPGGVTRAGNAAILREQLETNLFGMLAMGEVFADILAKNGGGAMLNMLSTLSWVSTPVIGSYCVSKTAAWGLTNAQRLELRGQGTLVIAFHAGIIDTDFSRGLNVAKSRPEDVVKKALDAVEAEKEEVMADQPAILVKPSLSNSVYLKDAFS